MERRGGGNRKERSGSELRLRVIRRPMQSERGRLLLVRWAYTGQRILLRSSRPKMWTQSSKANLTMSMTLGWRSCDGNEAWGRSVGGSERRKAVGAGDVTLSTERLSAQGTVGRMPMMNEGRISMRERRRLLSRPP